ncbi:MAG: hypothetical protein H6955_19310 [Chromatiaceae bacterium]|nr:hypothetical protein [Gammaproteobacteria bacterium]MCP5315715.1 hypothetical protein [Chromatiaceae bacterium]
MATKSTLPDHGGASESPPHGHLRDLIDFLHHLLLTVTSHMWHRRIRDKTTGEPKDKHEIWQKLAIHIEEMPVEERPATAHAAETSKPAGAGLDASSVNVSPQTPERGELGRYYVQKTIAGHPHIEETLKANTFEHINIACRIARQGNKKGAKVRIRLAEDAMHTASRFLSDQAYEDFRNEVERHLQSLVRT